ncbi:MAG: hypothetical protein AABY07_08040 [Nanoarchaeota archaeon]
MIRANKLSLFCLNEKPTFYIQYADDRTGLVGGLKDGKFSLYESSQKKKMEYSCHVPFKEYRNITIKYLGK